MISIQDNWARHDEPVKYPNLHRCFYNGYSVFYGKAVKPLYDKHTDAPFTFKTTISGTETYHYQQQKTAVLPGQYLLLNASREYSCAVQNPDEVVSLAVFFGTKVMQEVYNTLYVKEEILLDNTGHQFLSPPQFFEKLYHYTPQAQQIQSGILTQLALQQHNQLLLEDLCMSLLTELYQQAERDRALLNRINVKKTSTREECHRRISTAVDYLYANYKRTDIDLDTLSGIALLSPPHFSKLFKEMFNVSPYQYLKNMRLEKACELLKRTGLSVQEVAWSVGYEDCSAFIRSFKRKYQQTPEGFRYR
ncbi:AraC family transcriptional regulator [Chitinophaga pendula]|uniref:helix-turn-helix domain-containing protein n=1 Tax=Chitinophaga TaxID=79328 RepID=UPI000BAF7494|nr:MULTISPECIES: AraC family transcriptional regulator [Chitinophaga]ASZ12231.1 hypothetical protein CK934_15310 [Chitinophaga sp. MD30]UCJ04737.1 AraC family transcriptional regulator [Chitinophaga pendula]